MPEFNFSLRFKLGDDCEDPSQYLASLATHGCADAVVGVGSPGSIALDFSREAPTLMDAVASAVGDASRAMPGARLTAHPRIAALVEVEP